MISPENGVIDFEEFIKLVANIPFNDKEQEQEELKKAFKVFDKDGNGYIRSVYNIANQRSPIGSRVELSCIRLRHVSL